MTAVLGHRLRRVSVALLIATIAIAVLGPIGRVYGVLGIDRVEALGWVTVVIGDLVPTLLDIELAALVGGLVTGAVGFLIPSTHYRSLWDSWLRVVGILALLVAAGCAVFFSLIFTSDAYVVLTPASDSGCRLVARQFSFLFESHGTIGILRPGSAVVDWVTEYQADEGDLPFATRDYSLTWTSDRAHLTLSGSGTGFIPVLDDDPLTCR